MKVKLLLLLLVVFGSFSAYGQDKFLNGRVVNEESGEEIPFANIMLTGTTYGTSSDQHGVFTLRITDNMKSESLRITAVGFSTLMLNVGAAAAAGDSCMVRLKPVIYKIDNVDVYGKSLVYKKMLKEVVAHLADNYVTVPFNYVGYFIEKEGDLNQNGRFREAEVLLYNSAGYRRKDIVTAYKDVNYRFRQVRRNFEVKNVFDGLTSMDEIVDMDVVRNFRNVLDEKIVDDYYLKNLGEIEVNGRKVQAIGFTVKNPTPSNTGMENVTSFSGKIYIDMLNYAVLQYSVSADLQGRSYLGFDFLKGRGIGEPGHVEMLVTYKPYAGKYVLSGVSIVEDGKEVQFITTGLVTDNPEKIPYRSYYENLESDPTFWQTYSVHGI